MTPLAIALERHDWRSVALYLLLGVADAVQTLPEESLAALLDLLGDGRESGWGDEPDAARD